MEILISERSGCKSEYHAAIRADYCLAVFSVSAEVFKIAAASDCLHQRIKHHHSLGAYPAALLIYRAAVGAGISVADLFSVAAVILRMISAKISDDLYDKFVFLVIPFFHIDVPLYGMFRMAAAQ